MIYADVIVPLPLQGEFTYIIPDHYSENIMVGCRVIVQFGKKKFYTAIVKRIYQSDECQNDIKEIVSVLDDAPILFEKQFTFWEWISSYYMCTLGEVYKAALPSALKLESETLVAVNELFESVFRLSPNEEKVYFAASSHDSLRISEIEKITKIINVIPYIKSLADKGAIFLDETLKKQYSPKIEAVICLNEEYTEEKLHNVLDELKRAKKQQQLLLKFLDLREESQDRSSFVISKQRLLQIAATTLGVLDSLITKGILRNLSREVSRFNYNLGEISPAKVLNQAQKEAYEQIVDSFNTKDTVLLHGVTSSGKTEIYIQLINDALEKGKHVLYLLPEIALTTQITERLRAIFGDKLLVYHSKFNENERAETWHTLLKSDEGKVVLGARSAIFLPFKNLELIIVDEEHEASYKQQDPAPRYNAKNAAIVLANIYKSKTLLGTATPSIETYYNALSGRFGLVKLEKRYEEIELPEIKVIDTKDLRKRKLMKTILSPPLKDAIKDSIAKDQQVILFQNRRGFAPILECKTCSWTPKCLNCDVSLTYHKAQRAMVCHYCGAVYSIPNECPECLTPTLDMQGYGTERIEELVTDEIPESITLRMDLDTTRSKRAYEHIISNFEANKANVLIGTQMVSKGLDFENVNLVGILNADTMLNYPDFRAHERAFQLMTQVSGRAGRRNKRGTVVLQTAHPEHSIISFVKTNDYQSFYEMQLSERELFRYPPYYRLIEIIIRGKDENITDLMANEFSNILMQSFKDRVLGPTKPTVGRIQSLHIRKILLKIENQISPQKVRETIDLYQKYIKDNPKYKSILLHYDVDPM